MSEAITSPEYWKKRLAKAGDERHRAIFLCKLTEWEKIEDRHRAILAERIGEGDSILDAGCGWGRLLSLLPRSWRGDYLGVDLSQDFVDLASKENLGRTFVQSDLRALSWLDHRYDWAVLISIRPMFVRHLGADEWAKARAELKKVAKRLLYLEYDANDSGHVEDE